MPAPTVRLDLKCSHDFNFFSLRVPLIHDSTEVRAATLRTMRHLTKTKNDLKQLNDLHIPYLVTRCLDLELDNKVERLQALKLARNLAYISLSSEEDVFPLLLLRSIGKLISRNFSKYLIFEPCVIDLT